MARRPPGMGVTAARPAEAYARGGGTSGDDCAGPMPWRTPGSPMQPAQPLQRQQLGARDRVGVRLRIVAGAARLGRPGAGHPVGRARHEATRAGCPVILRRRAATASRVGSGGGGT